MCMTVPALKSLPSKKAKKQVDDTLVGGERTETENKGNDCMRFDWMLSLPQVGDSVQSDHQCTSGRSKPVGGTG